MITYSTHTHWKQGRTNGVLVTVVREEDSCGDEAVEGWMVKGAFRAQGFLCSRPMLPA